jgi:hypothetical protein
MGQSYSSVAELIYLYLTPSEVSYKGIRLRKPGTVDCYGRLSFYLEPDVENILMFNKAVDTT